MTSQDCSRIEIHGINNLQKWNKIMNAKKQLATLSLIALSAFGTLKAQTSNDNLLAFNDVSKAKTEKTAPASMNAPVVKEGNSNTAYMASKNKRIAIYVFGGTQGERTAAENAKILASAFADRRFTDKPMYITAVHREINEDQPSYVKIFMDGKTYTKNNAATFTPRQVGGGIDVIAEDFVDDHGNHLIIPERVQPIKVATLN
ncbi:hypothetical protein DS884_07370 [Tenacibaculum sp. E3R01]|uniref:hypothetical protein n=1 Tax=Tenacibaculum sp. E3R01 TaxID=2267227 RepID=UPI000DE92CF6|nr:hypothetical protein [Tenacibaculum sp. E3R01]RBW59546.1 hypothetical protein DS884_07370 [Tenacibaculum sp. E3R01]